MRTDRPCMTLRTFLLATALCTSIGSIAGAPPPPPPPPPEAPPAAPAPAPAATYPDLSTKYVSTSILKVLRQNFSGTLKRHGRQIYLEEDASSSGPTSYNEYYVYDFEKNVLYRLLRDEKIYFETPLTLEQRVDAIRKGWVPGEGLFVFNKISITLSTRDVPLRPDTIDGRPVELILREISAEIPAIGTVAGRTVRNYNLIWRDPAYALPVKISFGANNAQVIVEYRDIEREAVPPELFQIPKDFVNLTPF